MMGFDWGGILIAGMAGLLGTVLGGAVGAIFSQRSLRIYVVFGFAAIGLVAGIVNIRPNIEARFGDEIRQTLGPESLTAALQPSTVAESDKPSSSPTKIKFTPIYRKVGPAYDALKETAILQRVFADTPDIADGALFRLSKAYKVGGEEALASEAGSLRRELRQYAESTYIPRARDEHVLDYMLVMSSAARLMAERDPHLCFTWLYGPARGIRIDLEALIETLGEKKYQETQTSLANAITKALDEVPEFDAKRGRTIVKEATDKMTEALDDPSLAVLKGSGRPADDDQAVALCNAVSVLYETIAINPPAQAAAGYRFLLSQSQ